MFRSKAGDLWSGHRPLEEWKHVRSAKKSRYTANIQGFTGKVKVMSDFPSTRFFEENMGPLFSRVMDKRGNETEAKALCRKLEKNKI